MGVEGFLNFSKAMVHGPRMKKMRGFACKDENWRDLLNFKISQLLLVLGFSTPLELSTYFFSAFYLGIYLGRR